MNTFEAIDFVKSYGFKEGEPVDFDNVVELVKQASEYGK